jgi:Sulfatase
VPPDELAAAYDNLGFGEPSCYSGGPFRGAWTERIDAFAQNGFRMTNYAPEAQCTPSRSALLTGRYSVRSGTHSVPLGVPGGWGLVAWEQTLGDLLTDGGYSCAVYGKWHVGEGPGRWPTDKGFAEWYGPPRTYDEALWPEDPWYDPGRDMVSRMVQIKRGEPDVTEAEQLTLDVRRDCDAEYLRRAGAFIRASVESDDPFFVYFNHSLMHMPVIPREEFKDKSGNGDWADGLRERDLAERVLTITDAELDRIGELGAYYAWSEEALELGTGMGGTRALCLATIDVLERNMRDLHQTRTYRELECGLTPGLSDVELAQENPLRLRAARSEGQPPSHA